MEFRTKRELAPSAWKIEPCERMLFVGSCFADNIGRRFLEEKFRALVNPFGVMYNPVSINHTISRLCESPCESAVFIGQKHRFGEAEAPLSSPESTALVLPNQNTRFRVSVLTLGTNHVYREKESGLIVDNCQKRPANLFVEEELTIEECVDSLADAVSKLDGKVILTVSPIRYRKYGYHGSQLSKATLQLAAERLCKAFPERVSYFPAYEIMNDELRDYRFYQPDMLHPTQQAVDYIYERFAETYFSDNTNRFLKQWKPLKEALGHRPSNPDSEEYKQFLRETMNKVEALMSKYQMDEE